MKKVKRDKNKNILFMNEEITDELQKCKKIIDKETDIFKEEEKEELNKIIKCLSSEKHRTRIKEFANKSGKDNVFIYCVKEGNKYKVKCTTDVSEVSGLSFIKYNIKTNCINLYGNLKRGRLNEGGCNIS